MQALTIRHETPTRLARSLGWFSIGIGLAELTAPRALARFLGVREHPALIRALGLREIASGLGILTGRRRNGWLWARVGGDVIDLGLLTAAVPDASGRAAGALVAVAGVTALDVVASRAGRRDGRDEQATRPAKHTIMIDRSCEDLYLFWRNVENFPRVMRDLDSVRALDGGRSHWVGRGRRGTRVEWDAEMEVTGGAPGSSVAWRSVPGSPVETWGAVRFTPRRGGRGTLVEMEMKPGADVTDALRRCKWLIETGEIPTTEGQPAGPSASRAVITRMTRRRAS